MDKSFCKMFYFIIQRKTADPWDGATVNLMGMS